MANKEPGGSFGREGSSQLVIVHGEFFISCHSVDGPNHTHKKSGQIIRISNHHQEQAMSCAMCKKKGAPTCAGCGTVAYCNTQCQNAHWVLHRPDCARIKKEKKEAERGLSLMAALTKRYNEADIYTACGHGKHAELDKALLQKPALDVNWAEPKHGATAACISAQEGHDICLHRLISHGADIRKTKNSGHAPIHIACLHGRHACLTLLVDNGVDVNEHVADEHGDTPAMICSMSGHVKCLAICLSKGADPNLANRHGLTAVHSACQTGQVKIIQLLIARKADISMKDISGHAPLDYARMYKHRECIELLIVTGATGMNKVDLRIMTELEKV